VFAVASGGSKGVDISNGKSRQNPEVNISAHIDFFKLLSEKNPGDANAQALILDLVLNAELLLFLQLIPNRAATLQKNHTHCASRAKQSETKKSAGKWSFAGADFECSR